MKNIPKEIVEGFVEACHRVGRNGLARCSTGNLSMRLDNDRMLITASGSWMERLTPDDISLCQIADGSLIEGKKPSIEIGFHVGILQSRPDVNVVLHFQSTCATTLTCQALKPLNFFVISEIPFYIGPVATISFFLPGTKELAQAVTDAMRDHDLVMMGNHGQTTVACDVDHAIQNAVFFELACEILLRSGDRLVPLPEPEVRSLLSARHSKGLGG
jgi:ribulose-5-phosphate 4-epimerase/fuculose-1-phosphate aldolase